MWVEYGLQTVHDRTLEAMNRGHTFLQAASAIEKTARKGINVGVHVILGLPGESVEDMITTGKVISELPVAGVKLHLLHVLKDTRLEKLFHEGKIKLLSSDEYVKAVCLFISNLRTDCVIFRLVSDAKKEYLVAPEWMNDKIAIIARIEKEFASTGTSQGSALKS